MDIKLEQTTDFRELAKLNETVQTWHHDNYPDEFKPFDFDEIEKALKKLILSENFFSFIARFESKSIGYLLGNIKSRPESAFQFGKTILYIDQFAVIPDYQKSGVGQLLMDEAYRLAKQNNVNEVRLDYWSGNQLAENFYLRNGFSSFNHKMKKSY